MKQFLPVKIMCPVFVYEKKYNGTNTYIYNYSFNTK